MGSPSQGVNYHILAPTGVTSHGDGVQRSIPTAPGVRRVGRQVVGDTGQDGRREGTSPLRGCLKDVELYTES